MNAATFENAIFDPAGRPVPITRVEIEPLTRGRCRWILWSGRRRLYSVTVQPHELTAMLDATRMVTEANAGGPPSEAVLAILENRENGA